MDTAQMEKTAETGTQKSSVVWFEMQFGNVENAMKFYGEMFGWEFNQVEGLEPAYYMASTGDPNLGGGFWQRPEGDEAQGGMPDCTLYMGVESVANTMSHATELGASVVHPPMLIPGSEAEHFALLKDPEGVVFGLVGNA